MVLGGGLRKQRNKFFGHFFRLVIEIQIYEICEHFVFDLFFFRKNENSDIRKGLLGFLEIEFMKFDK